MMNSLPVTVKGYSILHNVQVIKSLGLIIIQAVKGLVIVLNSIKFHSRLKTNGVAKMVNVMMKFWSTV
ncbi:hypothetical protein D3C71_1687980 [compost metagenome]